MKLTENTTKVLKNLSTINPNLMVEPGNVLKTVSEQNNVMAVAQIEETFDSPFGIYNLQEFLSVYGMFEDPSLVFSEKNVEINDDSSIVRYWFADKSLLHYPKKEVTMPETDLYVDISDEIINKIRKASSVLGHGHLRVTAEAGQDHVDLCVYEPKDPSANAFTTKVSTTGVLTDVDVTFLINNLKLISGDYEMKLSKKGITNWLNKNGKIQYYIAIEK